MFALSNLQRTFMPPVFAGVRSVRRCSVHRLRGIRSAQAVIISHSSSRVETWLIPTANPLASFINGSPFFLSLGKEVKLRAFSIS